MTSKSFIFFLVSVLILSGLLGCQNIQKTLVDTSLTELSETDSLADRVKVISIIDYQEEGRDAYIAWAASVNAIFLAPPELVRISTYANANPTLNPNVLIAFEFANFADASKYMSRPEIAAVMTDNLNYLTQSTVHTFIERSAYSRTDGENPAIMGVFFINYLPGGRQSYLDWIDLMGPSLITPALASRYTYENYYGGSPHRLVEFGFSNREDGDLYFRDSSSEELDVRTFSWTFHVFELISVLPNP